jgi:hypothetical protein
MDGGAFALILADPRESDDERLARAFDSPRDDIVVTLNYRYGKLI